MYLVLNFLANPRKYIYLEFQWLYFAIQNSENIIQLAFWVWTCSVWFAFLLPNFWHKKSGTAPPLHRLATMDFANGITWVKQHKVQIQLMACMVVVFKDDTKCWSRLLSECLLFRTLVGLLLMRRKLTSQEF